jgi:hypothetical protein
MQLQNTYINKIYRVIYLINTDLSIAINSEFQEFIGQFNLFVQHHASSEGFGRAIDAVQIYYNMLLERMLDTQILSAAEALELAITHLEMAMREPKIRSNMQVVLLNEGISLLEETELKIIETLEDLLENSRQISLQN